MTETELTIKERKKSVGFRNSAPGCRSCVSYEPGIFSQPAFGSAPAIKGRAPYCKLYQFAVGPRSICVSYEKNDGNDPA